MEEWRQVVGWEGLYRVSSGGQIFSEFSKRMLRPYPAGAGYRLIHLVTRGRRAKRYVHQLVTEAFLGPLPPRHEINHRNDNKADNRLENLEYVTHHVNQLLASDRLFGGKRRQRKLTPKQVRVVRALPQSEMATLAREFGVARTVLRQIRLGITYRDI
jgi:hypothetical protein